MRVIFRAWFGVRTNPVVVADWPLPVTVTAPSAVPETNSSSFGSEKTTFRSGDFPLPGSEDHHDGKDDGGDKGGDGDGEHKD